MIRIDDQKGAERHDLLWMSDRLTPYLYASEDDVDIWEIARGRRPEERAPTAEYLPRCRPDRIPHPERNDR
jgi:hypothetical protein